MAWIQSEVYKASEPSKVRFFWASLSPIWCSGLMESTSSVLTKLGRGDGDISGTAHLYWPIWSPSGRFPGKHGWPSSWAYKALASRIQLASMLLSGLARNKNPKTGRNFNITVFELAQIRKHTSFLKMIVILFFFVWPNSSLWWVWNQSETTSYRCQMNRKICQNLARFFGNSVARSNAWIQQGIFWAALLPTDIKCILPSTVLSFCSFHRPSLFLYLVLSTNTRSSWFTFLSPSPLGVWYTFLHHLLGLFRFNCDLLGWIEEWAKW